MAKFITLLLEIHVNSRLDGNTGAMSKAKTGLNFDILHRWVLLSGLHIPVGSELSTLLTVMAEEMFIPSTGCAK